MTVEAISSQISKPENQEEKKVKTTQEILDNTIWIPLRSIWDKRGTKATDGQKLISEKDGRCI